MRTRGALGLVALALAACGQGSEPGPGTTFDGFCEEIRPRVAAYVAEAAREHSRPLSADYGGTLVVGGNGPLRDGMMALTTSDHGSTQHQQFVNLMPLIDYDDQFGPRPYLAESWELNDSSTELTFHLRQDVHWHDGEPTTARDVAFTYIRATDPTTVYPNAAYFANYVPGEAGVEVVDDYTVKVRLRPHSEIMDPWRSLAILPEHLLGEVPPDQLAGHPYGTRCPVGNGPFVFEEHVEGDRWIFQANPGFPQALGGRPYVDTYVYRYVPDQSTLLNELLAGTIDVYVAPPPDQVEQLLAAEGLHIARAPTRDFLFVGWNARRPQLADRRVRRAITMAVDREQIIRSIALGFGVVANSTLLPAHWAYDPAQTSALPYDPAAARTLLDEAGWTDRDGDGIRENADGLRLSVGILFNPGNDVRRRIVEVMQAQLREVGIEVRPQVMEWGALVSVISGGERNYDGVVLAWVGEFRVDDTPLFHSSQIDGSSAFSGTRDAMLDQLMDSLALVQDHAVALPLWRRYEAELREEQPYTFLYFVERILGVRNRVEGLRLDARGEWVNVKDWWLDPAER